MFRVPSRNIHFVQILRPTEGRLIFFVITAHTHKNDLNTSNRLQETMTGNSTTQQRSGFAIVASKVNLRYDLRLPANRLDATAQVQRIQ